MPEEGTIKEKSSALKNIGVCQWGLWGFGYTCE